VADVSEEAAGIREVRGIMLTSDGGLDETPVASQLMREIVAAMTDELGERPSITELVDVLMQSLPLGDDRLDLPLFPEKFVAIGEDKRPIPRSASRVGELNDAAFVSAARMISILLERRARPGHSVSADDLLSDLVDTIRGVPLDLLARPPAELREIHISGPPARRSPKVGDLVAIPAVAGGYYLALIVARNRFGTAFGFFRGRHDVPRPRRTAAADVNPHPIYSDERSILSGRWRIVGNVDRLLSLFPDDPEIYHRMGVAETADGATREVSDEEAAQVGLSNGGYRQAYMSEVLQRELDSGRFVETTRRG
jgi:hypothetical protein